LMRCPSKRFWRIPVFDAFFSLAMRVKQLFNLDKCQIANAIIETRIVPSMRLPLNLGHLCTRVPCPPDFAQERRRRQESLQRALFQPINVK
jgi:hypothetical protein